MFEIIAGIAVVLAIAVATVLLLAATKPDTFTVRRTAVVKAPAEKIFPLIDNFHQWVNWSPWEHRDPAMKRTYSGAEAGKGAIYAWDGNKNVGSGRMEILDASSPSKIVIKLDFFKPFEGHNTAEFSFAPERDAAATNISWVMRGPSSFMSKLMQVFMNLDRMIGKDFEAGLANLKRLTEK
jgi:Polyketide cyclase / dehydrase and lipid transport